MEIQEILDNQIQKIKENIDSKQFDANYLIKFSCGSENSFFYSLKKDYESNLKNNYKEALDSLSYFVKLIIKVLNDFEKHIRIRSQIRYFAYLRNKYMEFSFRDKEEFNSKIDSAINQLNSIKKEQLISNICVKNIKLFNALNDEQFTNYSDVIDYINNKDIENYIKNNITEKIEKITADDRLCIQKIDYLINDLILRKSINRQKKAESCKKIKNFKKMIEERKNEDFKIWPHHNNDDNDNVVDGENAEQCKETIFDKIDKYIDSLDESSLCLITALCAQLDFCKVEYKDIISNIVRMGTVDYLSIKSYSKYIRNWVQSFKRYLDGMIGGNF